MSSTPSHPHRPVLDDELARLRACVVLMGELVDRGICQAMAGLARRDIDRCTAVISEDARINALHLDARELSFAILLTQAPSACDLRETMGLLHMASELERMGDHCVSIAKLAREVAHQPEVTAGVDLSAIGRSCSQQVRGVLGAMIARSSAQARRVAAGDDAIDRAYRRAFDLLVQTIAADRESVYAGTQLLLVAHHLERIADRVTNIAEDLVFLETGVIEELG